MSTPTVVAIPLAHLSPHPANVRLEIDPNAVAGLAESIRTSGILEPLRVTPLPDAEDSDTGFYRIVAGHRRYAAAQLIGLESVPCIVHAMSPGEQIEQMLAENLQRENLTPIEEARGFERLAELGLSHGQIGKRLGLGAHRVAERLQLLKLPDDVQEILHKGLLPLKGVQALLRVPNPVVQRRFALNAARGHWSAGRMIEAVEREIQTLTPTAAKLSPKPLWKDAPAKAAAEPKRGRRALTFEWLAPAQGVIEFSRIHQAAQRACGVCGMADAESICGDCPMLELLDQLKSVAVGNQRAPTPLRQRVGAG